MWELKLQQKINAELKIKFSRNIYIFLITKVYNKITKTNIKIKTENIKIKLILNMNKYSNSM